MTNVTLSVTQETALKLLEYAIKSLKEDDTTKALWATQDALDALESWKDRIDGVEN